MDLSHLLDDGQPEFTELTDAVFDRVDLVKHGANGVPRFLIAKSADGQGLVPADVVRDLIGKEAAPEPGPAPDDRLTITGSVAAVAGLAAGLADHAAITKQIAAAARRARDTATQEVPVPDPVTKADGGGEMTGEGDLDPGVVLADPGGGDAPGSATDPGSPMWESVDAATARKWTSIAVRLKHALCVLSEREMLEAASADPDDCENAWDLQDAMCAVDYVIETLAVFAAGEQAEADLGGEAMAAIGKALAAFDPSALDVIEGLAPVAKAGRTLSSANEELIRQAAASLQKVLATLPAAPTTQDGGQPVAKETEDGMAGTPSIPTKAPAAAKPADVTKSVPSAEQQARNTSPVNVGGTTGMGQPRQTGPAAALPDDGPQEVLPGDVAGRQVIKTAASRAVRVYDHRHSLLGVTDTSAISTIAKADGDKKAMCVVYSQDGKLMGICDPDDITPVANSQADPDDTPAETPPAADMTPAPAATVGTPADAVTKTQDPAPDQGAQENPDTRAVLKSIVTEALADLLGAQAPAEDVAKQADVAGLVHRLDEVTARLETVEKHPAAPGVMLHGAIPPEGAIQPARPSLRGQDRAPGGGPPKIDIAKAMERRREFNDADPADQNRLATEMQTDAIGVLGAIHGRPTPA